MRADVRDRPQHAIGAPREDERLVDRRAQKGERQYGTRAVHALGAVDQLPAAREDAFADAIEQGGVPVEDSRQGVRPADVLIDHADILLPADANARPRTGSDQRATIPGPPQL